MEIAKKKKKIYVQNNMHLPQAKERFIASVGFLIVM